MGTRRDKEERRRSFHRKGQGGEETVHSTRRDKEERRRFIPPEGTRRRGDGSFERD